MTDGGFQIVVTAHTQIMAGVAGNQGRGRQARIEEKHFTKLYLFYQGWHATFFEQFFCFYGLHT